MIMLSNKIENLFLLVNKLYLWGCSRGGLLFRLSYFSSVMYFVQWSTKYIQCAFVRVGHFLDVILAASPILLNICAVAGGEEHGSSSSVIWTEAGEFCWPQRSVTWSCTHWCVSFVLRNIIFLKGLTIDFIVKTRWNATVSKLAKSNI